jgi:hypothetical protein
MSTNHTIYRLAREKCAYDSQIFRHLYDLEIKELVSTLSSSGLHVKPVHVLKSELIKPLTQAILVQAKKAKIAAQGVDHEEKSQIGDYARHIKAISLRYKKLEKEKAKFGKDDYRRYLRSLKSELSDVACLPVQMSEKRYKFFAKEIFKIDYFITNEMLKLNCERAATEEAVHG